MYMYIMVCHSDRYRSKLLKVCANRRSFAARVQVWLDQLLNCVVDNWGVNWQLRYTLMTIKRHEAMALSLRWHFYARQNFSSAIFLSPIVVAKFIFSAPNLLFLPIWQQWRSVARTLAYTFKGHCFCRTCENYKSLVLQDKYNIEIFCPLIYVYNVIASPPPQLNR